jgi:molecular chaperone Hsp33
VNEPDIEVRTYFARGRNALVARGDFSEVFAAWILHRLDIGIELSANGDRVGRDALAALTLHCAGRPWKEACAWTVGFPWLGLSVFAAGDNNSGSIVLNVSDGREPGSGAGIFSSDVVEAGRAPRRSVVEFSQGGFFEAAEAFYSQSEQRPARFFWHGDEDLVMVSAQPDCDLEWLTALDREVILRLDAEVELALLETRRYRFQCGCDQSRMLDFLVPIFARQGEELFGGEATLRIQCPRCGQRHSITREAVEARFGAAEPPEPSR